MKRGYGAEGATTRETLRQKDREGDDILESGMTSLHIEEAACPPTG
jgi:hypothetical protein